jgi:hypothetical protein
MLNTPPIELCLAPVFLAFLHMFFGSCMVLLKTMQHGSTCFFYSAKELTNVPVWFSIWISSTVKKSNPAAEPHGSPQGCTVRPRKGAGQCWVGVLSASLGDARPPSTSLLCLFFFIWVMGFEEASALWSDYYCLFLIYY